MIEGLNNSARSDDPSADLQFLFLINPASGHRHDDTLIQAIQAAFRGQGQSDRIHISITEHPQHATALAADFARQFGERGVVIACGGDGTAHEAANGIVGTQTALGILPLGTSNDFAKTVYPSLRLEQLISRLPHPDIRPIDLFQVNDRYCLNITSLGFDTKVQRTMLDLKRRIRRFVHLSYPLAILISLFGNRTYEMNYKLEVVLETPDHPIQTQSGHARFILAAISNGRYYGNGYFPSPRASVTDGVLDICMIDPLSLPAVLSLIPRYKKGTHVSHPAVHQIRTTGGRVWAPAGHLLLGNYDGESFEVPAIEFAVRPAMLRFAFY